jgi:hypothetical protein
MNQPAFTSQEPEPGYVAPPVPVVAAALPALSRQALVARIGLLGVAAAALIAGAVLILSSSASPNGTLAAGSGDSSNGAAMGPFDLMHGGGPGFRAGRGGPGFGGITITAINGNDIALKTRDGWTRTITVDSGTTYSESGATIALGDLKVGDEIGFSQTLESNGSWSIDSIAVILPRAGGQVTKIDGSTITVTQRDGSTATITVNGQTKYSVNGNDGAKLSDVKVGMVLVAEGAKNSDGSLTASNVRAGSVSTFEGRGGRFGHGFPFGPDQDGNGKSPSSTAAPSGSGAAS